MKAKSSHTNPNSFIKTYFSLTITLNNTKFYRRKSLLIVNNQLINHYKYQLSTTIADKEMMKTTTVNWILTTSHVASVAIIVLEAIVTQIIINKVIITNSWPNNNTNGKIFRVLIS